MGLQERNYLKQYLEEKEIADPAFVLRQKFKEVSEKFNIPVSHVEDIHSHIWESTYLGVNRKDLPTVYLKNFGSFKCSLLSLDVYVRSMISKVTSGKLMSGNFYNFLALVWPVMKRLALENKSKFIHEKVGKYVKQSEDWSGVYGEKVRRVVEEATPKIPVFEDPRGKGGS